MDWAEGLRKSSRKELNGCRSAVAYGFSDPRGNVRGGRAVSRFHADARVRRDCRGASRRTRIQFLSRQRLALADGCGAEVAVLEGLVEALEDDDADDPVRLRVAFAGISAVLSANTTT